MAVCGLVFVVTTAPWALVLAAFAGSLSVAGTDTGTFVTVDQAMLPQLATAKQRTALFALQNVFGTFATAVGSLAAGAVPYLVALGLHGVEAYRALFALFALIGLSNLGLFLRLSSAVEPQPLATAPAPRQPSRLGLGESRGLVGTLIGLNVIDSLAGGLMVQSIVAYWFYLVWGLDASTLAVLFFSMNVLSAFAMLSAGAVAARIGLLNTMLLSHIPQGIFGLLMPFAPSAWLAMAFWLIRNTIGFVFFPVRLSYVMGIVPPAERSAAAGYTTAARNIAGTITPALSGLSFSIGLLSLPFVAAGLMKLSFDALAFATLRGRRPPEERRFLEEVHPMDVATTDD
jgi:MFS family permease